MTRKGTQKVKTGCYTCKARKIKCDETKPECVKCIGTGRKCDGYPRNDRAAYSWSKLLSTCAIIPSPKIARSTRESRALEFFQHVVGPSLCSFTDREFWTRLVPAAAEQEPAVYHAMVSISSIYEQVGGIHTNMLDSPAGRFGLCHYNQALTQLASKSHDSPAMLFLCILFVCIEFLQSNPSTAIDHCRHGVKILNSSRITPWMSENLLPIFVRLSVFPYFFGGTVSNFPSLGDTESLERSIPPPYTKLSDAQTALDLLVARSIRFIRVTDPYRQGVLYELDFTEQERSEQAGISAALEQWLQDFAEFRIHHPPGSDEEERLHTISFIKSLVAKVWVESSLDKTEMSYDDRLASFGEIVKAAEEAISTTLPVGEASTSRTKFAFEMGYLPLLYLVVIKCRSFELRYAALNAMPLLANGSEGLWELPTMRALGKRVIELEHGIDLDAFARGEYFEPGAFVMPPDDARIRDSLVTRRTRTQLNAQGQSVLCMEVSFLFLRVDGFSFENEWLELGSLQDLPVPSLRLA